jgi:ketosteroid isomerase-like protein
MKTAMFTVVSLMLLSGCGAPSGNKVVELAQAKAGIQKSNQEFMAAITARNGAQLVESFYTDDAIVLPPGQGTVTGKAQIQAFFDGMIKAGAGNLTLVTDRVERNGDLAVELGRYTMTIKPPQGPPIPDQGKYIVVFRLQPGGRWKAQMDIFKSSIPPVLPPPPTTPVDAR